MRVGGQADGRDGELESEQEVQITTAVALHKMVIFQLHLSVEISTSAISDACNAQI